MSRHAPAAARWLMGAVQLGVLRRCAGIDSIAPRSTVSSLSLVCRAELYKRVLSVGSSLSRLGVERGEGVGILCDNSPEWVVFEQDLTGSL